MHAFTTVVTLVLSALAVALPAELQERASTQYTDTFDDLKTSVVAPQFFPVGLYHGIEYGGVVVLISLKLALWSSLPSLRCLKHDLQKPIEGAASVVPHSKPQQAGAAGPIDLLQLGQLTLNTYAQLVRGPGVKSFDLQSFYFGLGTDTGTTKGLAQGGTLAVTGFDVKGNQVPTVSLSYAPQGSQNQPLKLAVLPSSYKNLANVSIGVATSSLVTERTYIALDDVKHVNYS